MYGFLRVWVPRYVGVPVRRTLRSEVQSSSSSRIAAAMLSVTSEKWAILAILNLFFLVIGMFLHSAAAIVLVVPIVMPVVLAAGKSILGFERISQAVISFRGST